MKHIKTGKERTKEDLSALRKTVSEIIEDVVANGDAALRSYSEKFDGFARPVFRVSREEIDDAYSHVSEQELNDMKSALANIRTFAEAQRATIHDLPEFQPRPGILLGHRVIPVQSCCCYVPGGRFPLYSSAMMLITPAKVAGVKRIMRCLCRRSKHCEDFFLVGELHSKGVRSVLEGKVAFDKIKAVL